MVSKNEIMQVLQKTQLFTSVELNSTIVAIYVYDGDWKHEHIYCDKLMRDLGLIKLTEQVIGNSDSDCYSAIHYYLNKK